MTADTIARLKITLDDVEPTVLRRVEVPFDIRLDRLHLTIQAAMGWTAISMNSAPAMSAGARRTPMPVGQATSSTLAKPGSVTSLKTSARKNSSISTTSATAGSTPSRSSVLSIQNPANSIRV
jgi:Plasmid pRiA4b ORF-3-like protein